MSEADLQKFAKMEVDNLKMLRSLDHPHLIKAIAYYIKDGKHCIIFPWADRGQVAGLVECRPTGSE
jgi:hypothetical protein